MKRLSTALFILFNLLFAQVLADDEMNHAVLISAAGVPVAEFTNKELRLLYLGYSVTKNAQKFKPLINASDKVTYSGFLQKIIFMSENNYDRKLLTRIFRHGGERPRKFNKQNDLIENIKMNPNTVTFVRTDVATKLKGIQMVQRLW